jgi:dTDP-4-amino-4,6-dideoxygalactose transaminase
VSAPIYVTRPYLPPLEELIPYLEEIWRTRMLSNAGPFHQQLEARLREFLGVPNISLVTNGMVALEQVIDAAALKGEIVTTPYSFVATTHAVRRAQLEPVFVDVKPDDLNIDPAKVEEAITERTSAIVAVHCYGNPCDVDALDAIAQKHGLTLIYDAAHAFAVRYRGRGLLSWGDYATLSLHATKALNTFEGGAIVTRAADDKRQIERQRNFGIIDEVTIGAVGTNAKMSEIHAAVGLVQLDHYAETRRLRGEVDRRYREALAEIPGIEALAIPPETEPNYSYFPVLVGPDFAVSRDALHETLCSRGLNGRRYFYPLLSNLPMYRDLPSAAPENLPVANEAAAQILCLPIFPELSVEDQERILDVIRSPR